MSGILFAVISVAGVMLMELFGAIRAFEIMAFARKSGKSDGQHEQRENFHRRAS
jgi:hypothetical protein